MVLTVVSLAVLVHLAGAVVPPPAAGGRAAAAAAAVGGSRDPLLDDADAAGGLADDTPSEDHVVTLDDASFEHDTQAAQKEEDELASLNGTDYLKQEILVLEKQIKIKNTEIQGDLKKIGKVNIIK